MLPLGGGALVLGWGLYKGGGGGGVELRGGRYISNGTIGGGGSISPKTEKITTCKKKTAQFN